jgi:hypothetical protein
MAAGDHLGDRISSVMDANFMIVGLACRAVRRCSADRPLFARAQRQHRSA